MGKKKAFIDKKNAVTYSLVFANEGEHSGTEEEDAHGPSVPPSSGIRRVLVPVDEVGHASSSAAGAGAGASGGGTFGGAGAPPSWLLEKFGLEPELPPLEDSKRKEILELGFPDDGYDYLKHLREARPDRSNGATTLMNLNPGAEGGFVAANEDSKVDLSADVKLVDARRTKVNEDVSETEQEKYDLGNFPLPSQKHQRQGGKRYVSSTLSEIETLMEEMEMKEEGEIGDLQDDFLILATEGADLEEEEDCDAEEDGRGGYFDDEDEPVLEGEELEQHRKDHANARGIELTESRQIMEECFDQLVDEYDELEIGDLECADLEQTEGRMDITQFDNILDEFISEKKGKEYVVYEQQEEKTVRKPTSEGEGEGEVREIDDSLGQERAIVREDLDDESKFVNTNLDLDLKTRTKELAMKTLEDSDSKQVDLSDTKRLPVKDSENWDCESVLSLRSNFDNHPGKITSESGKRASNKQATIRLSKHGIPLDYVQRHGNHQPSTIEEEAEEEEETTENGVEDVVLVRQKGETAEQKKARKQAVKQMKREARANKKEMKNRSKEARKRQQAQTSAHEGVSIRPM